MKHSSRLHPKPFEAIKNNIKCLEHRLNDEKRQTFSIGDIIEFTNRLSGEKLEVKILNLHFRNTFQELFHDLSKDFEEVEDSIEWVEAMLEYYPIEKQKKYGVVAIEIELKTHTKS